MSSHTPGPWTVAPCSFGGHLLQRGEVVDGRFVHPQHSLQIVPAEDAVLMSAAPDLLEALKAAIDTIKVWHSIYDSDDEAWDIYRQHAPEMKPLFAAIAKAEGR